MSLTFTSHRPEEDSSRTVRDMPSILKAQRAAFESNPPRYAERLEALRSLDRMLLKHQDDIIGAIAQDFGGRPAEETVALELFPLLNEIRFACRHLKKWMAPRSAKVSWHFWPGKARIIYQPLGVVGILSSWNYPLYLSLAPVAGALAAGNHVLLKPSESTPATAQLLESIIASLYPAEYVTVIRGGPDVADQFSHLPFDHLLFTGSGRIGKQVMKAASENLVPVTLELGGKSPAIVHDDFPLNVAVERILLAKLFNAGQTCVAPDYVILPPGRRDEFVAAAQKEIARMYPALVKNPDYTRIINVHHYRRLVELVDDAKRRGANVIEVNPGGETCDESSRVFPPTIITGIRDDMAIAREEIFGPVLPIVELPGVDEAVAYTNGRPHPLALYYFDYDSNRAEAVVAKAVAGGVTVNDCMFHVGQMSLPFGGVGPSGMGRYHGFEGFQTFSNKKGIFIQRRLKPLSLLRPPYNSRIRRLFKFLLRL